MTQSQPFSRRLSCFIFWLTAALVIACCLKGGFFGHIGKVDLNLNIFGKKTVLLPAGRFILLFSITWALSLCMLLLFPRQLSMKRSFLLILALSAVCRLALLPHEPSDDVNRYLWEGRMLNEGISPYHHAPDDPSLAGLAKDDPFHAHINHPSNPAAYPPFILYLFSFVIRAGYSPMVIKVLMILFDMGAVGFLLFLLNRRHLDLRWSVLYAFNPVILYSFAGQGHFDAVQNFFLMGAIYFYHRKSWGRMFLFAGLAVQSKYVAAVTIPFLINRDNFKFLWVAAVTITTPYLPLVDTQWLQLFSCIVKFGEDYAFNGSIHGLLRAALGGIHPATDVCKILLVASLFFGFFYFHPKRCCRFTDDPVPGCLYSLGALLLLAPTIHFWYLSWIIPFLALRPSLSWIVLCLTIGGYFVANGISHHTGEWKLPVWAQITQWLPFYLIFWHEIYLFWHRARSPVDPQPPRSVSVVVPVKNEAKLIKACIDALFLDKAVCEVIVVDSFSTDRTPAVAGHAGAKVIKYDVEPENGGGRGGQIYTGVMAARGDAVAIVHADTLATAPAFTRIIEVLGRNPAISGGALGGIFDDSNWRFRFLELANDFRMVFFGISFGDQVQFFRRKPVVEQDLFPRIPLMEDVEFSIRLHRVGRQIFLFGEALVSSRRWQTMGYRNSLSIINRVASYLWKRLWGNPDTLAMYRSYYGVEGVNRGRW